MKRYIIVLAVMALAVGLLTPVGAAETPTLGDLSVPQSVVSAINAGKVLQPYIVMMAGDPAIAYEGTQAGYAATKPAKGKKLNPNSGKVKRYVGHLNAGHDKALNEIGVGQDRKFYDYSISFNGFAAMLNASEAAALMARGDVMLVWVDELRQPTTDVSPGYLGVPDVWDGGNGFLGDGVIVGVIDTGIWPENPSFSDQIDLGALPGKKNGKKFKDVFVYTAPSDWHGACQSGEQWSQDDCNNKLIGATYFVDGFGKRKALEPGEYLSPRDWDGHGTHTSSTAAGNKVTGDFGTISGMAPRAYIAMYKACWNSDAPDHGCATSDLVAAIDQAVADGVNVINYSIGSPAPGLWGPDDLSFLFAEAAGIFVSVSNGNEGPGANTTGSPSSIPWVTSVGATNHRLWLGEATLGNGDVFSGASLADPNGTDDLPLVDAADHGNPLCYPEVTFVPPITDQAVLCWRGDIARVDKSRAVFEQGGVGMILANVLGGATSINADVHSVPSIHVDAAAGAAIGKYIRTEDEPTVDIAGQLGGIGAVAGFSSRGLGASPDLIKPDIAAPGVSVLAADAEVTYYGINLSGVGYKSGTSMASPHIAGIGALMVEAHPDWSPAQIKSALMTTADPFATFGDDGVSPATPFDTGSGLVQPFGALDPGLTYEAGSGDYLGFVCGSGIDPFVDPAICPEIGIDPSDLNQPNIAVGELAGVQTVTRTVTNVGPAVSTYKVSVEAPPGIRVSVKPDTLTLAKGEPKSYDVTFTREGAALDVWAFGSLTWSDGTHSVRSALAVRPVQADVPAEVMGSGTDSSLDIPITFGYSGDYSVAVEGLVRADMQRGNVVDDPANDINVALDTGVGITVHAVDVPVGSTYARFSLFDDYTDGNDDLDLYVFGPNPIFDSTITDPEDPRYPPFVFVGGSGSETSAEEVSVPSPETGNTEFQDLGLGYNYLVIVHGWQTDGPDASYTLFSWAFGPGGVGNATLLPVQPAVSGATGTITVGWSGLNAGTKYLGAVTHSDSGGIFARTIVRVDTD